MKIRSILKSLSCKLLAIGALTCMIATSGIVAQAAPTSVYPNGIDTGAPRTGTSLDNNPFVTWSPDYGAWTLSDDSHGPYDTHFHVWNDSIDSSQLFKIYTGVVGSEPTAPTGYHVYAGELPEGAVIPIGRWECVYSRSFCIQTPDIGNIFCGMTNTENSCLIEHHPGWFAVCANCGERIKHIVYGSDAAVSSVKSIPVGLGEFYYCPRTVRYQGGHPVSGHFEQAAPISHKCTAISPNRYKVVYNANFPVSTIPGYKGTGFTANTLHSYDNKMVYDGVRGTYATNLRKNSYYFIGYKFAGWNTKPDGSGRPYSDGQAVLNLTSVDDGVVNLYAQWAPSSSSLVIDPAGGKFDGSPAVQTFPGTAGSTFSADASRVTPPAGVTATFHTNGGSACGPITNTQKFVSWKSGPLYGTLNSNNIYTYPKADSVVDRLTATYDYNAITLPSTSWPGHSFGGWYFDAAFTKPAGSPGDKIVIKRNTDIYAQWAELRLTTVDNYNVYGGAGAVNCSWTWTQPDATPKSYKLFQSMNGTSWTQLYTATDTSMSPISVTSGKTSGSTYTVTASGIYDLSVSGAQGGNYGGKSGGKGGKVDVRMYLKKGDVVKYIVGGQDGSNGGGSGDMGNGGGWSAVYVNNSIVAIAGGGGGANTGYDGGAGGLSTNTDTSTNTGKNPTDGKGSGGGGGYGAGAAGDYIPVVMGVKIKPLDLSRGSIYTAYVDYWRNYSNGSSTHNARFTPKYVFDFETNELIYTFNNHGTTQTLWGIPWRYNDHFTINGHAYYCIMNKADHDREIANNPIVTDNGSAIAVSSLWDTDTDQPYVKMMYCGYDDVGNVADGSFGNKFMGVSSDKHGVTTEWHANGHLYFGELEEFVKTPASTNPSYGGSSHVYSNDYIASSSMTAGSKTGDGSFSLKSVALGFLDVMYLNNVKAYDKARPDKIDKDTLTSSWSNNAYTYTWKEPASNGTAYYHKVQSFRAGSDNVICESNITENTLTSRITGYHYRIDTSSLGEVSATDSKTTSRSMSISQKSYDQWLHIAAIDAAGNIGPALHIMIPKIGGSSSDFPVRWDLYTDQIDIEGTDNNVYHSHDKTYYVRADGSTPFGLSGNGTMNGKPYAGYVINGYGFVSDSVSKNGGTYMQVSGTADGPVSSIDQWSDAVNVLDPYPGFGARYSGGRTVLSGNSSFTMADGYDGISVKVWPRAYVRYMEELHEMEKWSDNAADKNNGLILIGDARPPVIHGLEVFEDIEIIDKDSGPFIVDIWCDDSGSGVGGFTVTITNTDTGATKTWESNGEHLFINVTGDDSIFIGDFTVTVDAHDNVWNTSQASANTREFQLTAWITRILPPHDPNFREGESGILHVKTLGFADRIEVTFPGGLEGYSKVIDYENDRRYEQNDEIQFMIPLYYLRDYYGGVDHKDGLPLIVKAYKGSEELTATPKMSVFNLANTVLEEFRDRLK